MINIDSINQVDAATLQDAEAFLTTFIKNYRSDIDISPASAFYRYVVVPAAYFYAVNQANATRLKSANSLKLITEDPSIADPDTFDNLLSNYFITRATGSQATGKIRLVLSENRYTSVSGSTTFTVNGLVYTPTRNFVGITSSDQAITGNELVITPLGNNFSFVIDVICKTAGEAGNVKQGTIFTSNLIQPYITKCYADADFDTGSDEDTNEELLSKLNIGLANRNLNGRPSIKANIQTNYPSVVDVSIIGAGDSEMRRDKHNMLGISSFGKVDVYTRTRQSPVKTTITKSATATSTNTWTLSFTRDEYPVIYRVDRVQLTTAADGSTTLPLLSVNRGYDSSLVTGLDITPVMQDNEHVFTRYQTYSISFTYSTDGFSVGDTKDFAVDVVYMPQIDEINDYFTQRPQRSPGGDYLFKAPVPCFIAITINIVHGIGDPEVDTAAIQAAVTAAVNSLDYQQNFLSNDIIASTVKALLPRRSRISQIYMRGEILLPLTQLDLTSTVFNESGSYWIFNGNPNDAISAPTIPEYMVSPRTVAFFTSETQVSVNVLPSDQVIV